MNDGPETALYFSLAGLAMIFGFWAAVHALISKRRPQSAFGWVVVCTTLPMIGALAYFVFGINRIRTRARVLHSTHASKTEREKKPVKPVSTAKQLPEAFEYIGRVSAVVARWPVTTNNTVRELHNGEETYPAMLEAIRQARDRVYLSTYIFDSKGIGQDFLEALSSAKNRGVDVRVLIDGVGELYSRPRVRSKLKKLGIRFARFIPPRLIPLNTEIQKMNALRSVSYQSSLISRFVRHSFSEFPCS